MIDWLFVRRRTRLLATYGGCDTIPLLGERYGQIAGNLVRYALTTTWGVTIVTSLEAGFQCHS
jgi:hypothetical protein